LEQSQHAIFTVAIGIKAADVTVRWT